ncbi:hypothetical protein ABMA27_009878 [Loxostege sticticalis]|uniref:lysozyme n=1 Tax=Loxostege sticticalis TaxID=481309 RepID=A0ABR3H746_LOXSC
MSRFSKLGLLVFLYLVQGGHNHARVFNRCQLSRELLRYNFPRSLITNWVCLIEHTSGRATDRITSHNDSSTSYGLFQHRISVTDLLNEDLADDVRCAKRVYDRVGFNAWPTYSHCKKKTLPDLSRC